MSDRSAKLRSLGWTEEGRRLIEAARNAGVCAGCGRPLRSKYPPADARRRVFCWNADCDDLFYESHYRAWSVTKRAVLRRVRARFDGQIRCERCKRDPDVVSPGMTSYEFDHVVEIAAGGNPFDQRNVQLLCLPCHRRKTRAFARRGTPSALPPSLLPLEAFH